MGLGSEGVFHLNQCGLETFEPRGEGSAPNPAYPALSCVSEADEVTADPEALLGKVGLVAMRYQDYK